MGVGALFHGPEPVGIVDDILRPAGENPLLERGFLTTNVDTVLNWARIRSFTISGSSSTRALARTTNK